MSVYMGPELEKKCDCDFPCSHPWGWKEPEKTVEQQVLDDPSLHPLELESIERSFLSVREEDYQKKLARRDPETERVAKELLIHFLVWCACASLPVLAYLYTVM